MVVQSRSASGTGDTSKRSVRPQFNFSAVVNYALLASQVVLLVLLTQRVANLEAIIRGSIVAENPSPAPTVLAQDPTERGQVLGPANAAITVVEFSDFECPFCAQASATVKRLMNEHPNDIRLVYRHFPLQNTHPNARPAAEASECAAQQGKFWEMHDLLFANQKALAGSDLQRYAAQIGLQTQKFSGCLSSEAMAQQVQQDLDAGKQYGVDGTPTFFVNKKKIVGGPNLEKEIASLMRKT